MSRPVTKPWLVRTDGGGTDELEEEFEVVGWFCVFFVSVTEIPRERAASDPPDRAIAWMESFGSGISTFGRWGKGRWSCQGKDVSCCSISGSWPLMTRIRAGRWSRSSRASPSWTSLARSWERPTSSLPTISPSLVTTTLTLEECTSRKIAVGGIPSESLSCWIMASVMATKPTGSS